ncbi:MAG: hypothetical protein L6R38_005107 [Xanthoria sp. 2 TBL-2021]|nr:MAG: hypothetical protein L6R38_005107 [Xanthoria sp. 2 TBL-2021]
MSSEVTPDPVIDKLQGCGISDALLKPKHLHGGFSERSMPPSAVVFISAPQGTVNALYLGLMSCRAQYLGAAGTVVDGVCQRYEYRVAAGEAARGRGTFPPLTLETSARQLVILLDADQLLRSSPVTGEPDIIISPGDILIGDIDGVACLPQALVEQVMALMPSQVAADEIIMEALRNGSNFTNASKELRAKVKSAEDL